MDNRATSPTPLTRLRERYLGAQLRGDRSAAIRAIVEEGLDAGHDPVVLQREVIQEAQREIGRLWHENAITIAHEHMATAISQVALAHLYQHARRSAPVGRSVIVACVEGELHDLPARIAADALDLAGFEVRYLGANVPTSHLLKIVEAEPPDLLALSVTMPFNLPALEEAVAKVRDVTGHELPILAGGHALSWAEGIASELALDGSGGDAAELIEQARRLLGICAA